MEIARKLTGSALVLLALWNAWWLIGAAREGAGAIPLAFFLLGTLACAAATILLFLPPRNTPAAGAEPSAADRFEQWKTLAVESAREVILLIDEFLLIRYANPAVETVFGYRPGELLGKSLPLLIPTGVERHHARQLIDNGLLLHETGRTRDGGLIPVEIILRKVANREGMLAVAVIHEARREAAELDECRSRLEQLEQAWRSVPAPVIVLDARGRIVRWNRICERITEYALAEVRDTSYWDGFLSPEDIERSRQLWESALSADNPVPVREQWRTRTGALWDVLWLRSPLRDDCGRLTAVVAVGMPPENVDALQDAGENREAAALALRMDDQLTAIQGHSELLLSAMDSADPSRPEIEAIHRAACRAVEIAHQWRSLREQQRAGAAPAQSL